MKRLLLLMLLSITVILFSITGLLVSLRINTEEVKKTNQEYEYYLNKEIYGTEVTTLINKVIDQNERNSIAKDEKGYYIDNGENSIKIEFKMITIERTYQMEDFYNNDINEFLANFNTIRFKCTNIEYHEKTGKISKLVIEQLEY